jgi:serine/threonine protein kinase
VTATASDGRNVPLVPGATVGEGEDCRWRVMRHIADGGFSSVYEVQPDSPATTERYGSARRALKCLWGTPAELTAIGGEAAKMAAVSGHDNVLGLVGSFRFDGALPPHPHYVGLLLELAAEDLRHFAGRSGPTERAWAAVFEQVAAGLEHIHGRRVVHGDIKPTNVLRVDGRFAIADFGVAAPLETTRSAGIGLARTIAFWPPESASQGVLCADGVRRPPAEGWRATQAGDVWALAVSMHRMLTGRHITPGTTPEQQYELVCLGKYSIDDRLGAGWHRLLSDCLAHDPQQRAVSTAADLRGRLSDLALAGDFDGVPWTDGRPRVVAVLDLGADRPDAGGLDPITRPGPPPALDGPARSGLEPGQPTTRVGTLGEAPTDLVAEPPEPARAAGTPGTGPQRPTTPDGVPALVLYLTQPGGRVHGAVLPSGGLLLEATRHLAEQVVPTLAKQARDHARRTQESSRQVTKALPPHQPRPGARPPDDVAATIAVGRSDRTRQLTVAVADVTRQRDALAGERDQLARHRDEVAGERDRLRQQYTDLARRLDRLERDNHRRDRDMSAAPTAVYRAAEPLLGTRREAVPVVPSVAPVAEDPPKRRPAAGRERAPRPPREPVEPRPYRRRRFRGLRRFVVFLVVLGILVALGLSFANSLLADHGLTLPDVVHKVGDVVNGS